MDILGPSASVLGFSKTALNYWTGASPRSIDGNVEYPFPTLANSPCLYNENVTGVIGQVMDDWGPVLKQYKRVGDSSYRNSTRGASGSYGLELSFIQKYLATYSNAVGAIKCSLGGTGLAADWMPANTGSNAGADKGQFAILRKMITEAAARNDVLYGAGNWRWGGFIWMQGENGAHTTQGIPANDNAYLSDARAMFAVVRGLTRSDLPVIVGRIGDNWINTNSELTALGYPYAAIDSSISFNASGNGDGRTAGNSTLRANALGGTNLRRTTNATLGGDQYCAWWSNDGFPPRPLFWSVWATFNGITVATEPFSSNYDFTAYHWSDVGNLTAGERAFASFQTVRTN